MKLTDKAILSKYRNAVRQAHECVNSVSGKLPDAMEISQLAAAILQADLLGANLPTGREPSEHAGQDEQQDGMLENAYGDGPSGF